MIAGAASRLEDEAGSTERAPVTQWRLGVATRVIGAPLKSHDSRRWAQNPHLSVSLAYLRDLLGWLAQKQIRLYRLSGNLAPYATHPDHPHFHRQLQECQRELAAIGDLARSGSMRLTMHPAAFVRLDAADEALARRSQQELLFAASLLEAMGLGEESVIVLHASQGENLGEHVRGIAGVDALARFARRVETLPRQVRARLVLENGDRACDLPAALWVQRRTGLPVVLDLLHHRCNNRLGIPAGEGLQLALATWPRGVRAKVHLSSPRTEMRLLRRMGVLHAVAPLPQQHSDYVNVFECIELLRHAEAMAAPAFDIMVEAKAHDLAVLRLREQIGVFAPELCERVL